MWLASTDRGIDSDYVEWKDIAAKEKEGRGDCSRREVGMRWLRAFLTDPLSGVRGLKSRLYSSNAHLTDP